MYFHYICMCVCIYTYWHVLCLWSTGCADTANCKLCASADTCQAGQCKDGFYWDGSACTGKLSIILVHLYTYYDKYNSYI